MAKYLEMESTSTIFANGELQTVPQPQAIAEEVAPEILEELSNGKGEDEE